MICNIFRVAVLLKIINQNQLSPSGVWEAFHTLISLTTNTNDYFDYDVLNLDRSYFRERPRMKLLSFFCGICYFFKQHLISKKFNRVSTVPPLLKYFKKGTLSAFVFKKYYICSG